MRILGIDPGTATTGFGVVDKAGTALTAVAHGVIRTPAGQAAERRLKTIFDELSKLITEYQPALMAVELLYFASNVTTAMSVSQARGVVLLAGAQAAIPISEYTPLQVKQAVTGYGQADKSQMQAMVAKLLKLTATPKPDDAADALAIAICASVRKPGEGIIRP